MSENILLIAKVDEAYRQLLLESEGLSVRRVDPHAALPLLREQRFRLAMITTERGIEATIALCQQLKQLDEGMRVVVLAQRAEYLPPNPCVDALIREQYSPGKFLATIRKLIDEAGGPRLNSSPADQS